MRVYIAFLLAVPYTNMVEPMNLRTNLAILDFVRVHLSMNTRVFRLYYFYQAIYQKSIHSLHRCFGDRA